MSASTSPSVHVHPISPSSSLSSTDSAPHSEPTSDEQPDLGAFTTVLREWTHLQPPPRIPVQIHSATSSTTPTYQPEQSVIGSDFRGRSGHSRLSNSNRSRFSDLSSFTRPPSSSVHPEGSTVWNQALIASYLASTPSNDVLSEREEEEELEEEELEEEEFTPSPPNSLASTALTVEIASETDYPSYDESSHDVQPNASPYTGVFLAIPVGARDSQRLDSRETAHRDDEADGITSHTSRDYVGSQLTSMQLQSQARVPTSTSMSGSMSIPTVQTGLPSETSIGSNNTISTHDSKPSTTTSTLITALLNRGRNPLPPRTTSDSSYTTTGSAASSSNLSLLSYQIPETPPIEEEEDPEGGREDERVVTQQQQAGVMTHFSSSGHSNPSMSSGGSGSLSLKSQRSITSHSPSASASTLATQTQGQAHPHSQTQSQLHPQPQQPLPHLSQLHSHPQQPLQQTQLQQQPLRTTIAPSVLSNESPLFNPHSPLPPPPQPQPRHPQQHPLNISFPNTNTGFGVIDDIGTPDQPPSETLLYEAYINTNTSTITTTTQQKQRDMLLRFIPVDDLDVDDDNSDGVGDRNSFGRNRDGPGRSVLYSATRPNVNPGSSSLAGPSSLQRQQQQDPYTQTRPTQPRIQPESQYNDDIAANGHGQQGEFVDAHHPYRYSYDHNYKSYAQAMTPKGIPRTDVSARAPPEQAMAQDVLRQLESTAQSQSYATTRNQGYYHESFSGQRAMTHHDSNVQPTTTTKMQMGNEALQQPPTASQAQSLPQSQLHSSYEYPVQQSYGMTTDNSSNTQRFPPVQAPPSSHNSTITTTTSTYSSQTQSQPIVPAPVLQQREMYTETTIPLSHPQPQHRYPYSLIGLHALPASLISPPAQDLPIPTPGLHDQEIKGSGSGNQPGISFGSTVRDSSDKEKEKDKGKSKDNVGCGPGLSSTTTATTRDNHRPLIVEADFVEHAPQHSELPANEVSSHLPMTYNARSVYVHAQEQEDTTYQDEDEQSLPSLGYLDAALSFIAAERARMSAAREGSGAGGSGGGRDQTDSREVGGGEEQEGEKEAERDTGTGNDKEGAKGKQTASDNEPKRRRRRKRPPRAHATPQVIPGVSSSLDNSNSPFPAPPSSAPASSGFEDGMIGTLTPGLSPKKKKRSTSVAASAASSKRSLLLESPSRSKNKGKVLEKEFLVPLPQPSFTILRRPTAGPANDVEVKDTGFSDDEEGGVPWEGDSDGGGDGGRTPTNNGPNAEDLQPLTYTGRRGRRVGRKERERERMKREIMKQEEEAGEKDASGNEGTGVGDAGSESDDNIEDDGDEAHEDEEGEIEGEQEDEQEDEQEETDSLSNMALLKPPRKHRSRSRRRRARDRAYIHDMAGVTVSGVYKSTPGSPRRLKFDEGDLADGLEEEAPLQAPMEVEAAVGNQFLVPIPSIPLGRQPGEKKKRTRSKRYKTLTRAKSDPELRLDGEGGSSAPVGEESGDITGSRKSKKGKNKAQDDDSMDILDMDRTQIQKLIFASSGAGSRLLLANQQRLLNSRVPPPPHSKRGRMLTLATQLFQLFPEQHKELGSIISRIEGQGVETWPPKGHRTLRSNISIDPYGLYGSFPSTLKRKKLKKSGHIRTGSEGAGGESFEFDMESFEAEGQSNPFRFPGIDEEDPNDAEIDPRGQAPKKGDVLIHVFIDHSNILIGLLSHLKRHTSQRKIVTGRGQPASTVLSKTTTTSVNTENLEAISAFAAVKSTSARPLPIPTTGDAQRQPVPVPKGGKPPIPLPSFATMSRSLPTKILPTGSALNGNEPGSIGATSDGNDNTTANFENEESAGPVSLFVGSIKKEKKIQKHLWHAALALILERGRSVARRVVVTSSPLYQPMESMENLGYELRVFIRVPDLGDGMDRERYRDKDRSTTKGVQSSPVTIPGSSLSGKKTHDRQVSGSESGSTGAGSGHASGGGGSSVHAYTGMANTSTTQTKVKYREQGVDELLQLKLHQAIAATDIPPLGSTIVLATGDGNVGQFNEDGFLGPIRLALRRGWRVELYAWEEGLSRAWRREFGPGTEWGRMGMFRVIGMEQFASALVEAPEWS